MALNKYSNLNKWIDNLDKTLEKKLARRVEEAIHIWTTELKQNKNELEDQREVNIVPGTKKINLEIRIVSQMITVVPALEKAKATLFEQFSAWHSIITDQPRISCNRFQQSLQQYKGNFTYKNVLTNFTKQLADAYEAINAVVKKAEDYFNQWTRYQSLWDLRHEIFLGKLGTNLTNWMKVIMEMKKARAKLFLQLSQKQIFPFVVECTRVQEKIALKYDFWRQEVQRIFADLMGNRMRNFFTEITKARCELEAQSGGIDSANASDAIALVTKFLNLKKQMRTSQEEVNKFVNGQKLLATNGYIFPQSWLNAESVQGQWMALTDVYELIQAKFLEGEKMLEKHIEEWNKSKSIQGSIGAKEAIVVLRNFEEEFRRLKDEQPNIIKAKNALEISESVEQTTINKLENVIEEIGDLSNVWQSFLPIYDSMDELKEEQWLSMQPRKLCQNLEERQHATVVSNAMEEILQEIIANEENAKENRQDSGTSPIEEPGSQMNPI